MKEQSVTMTNAEVVASCLKRHDVEYIFGQSNPSAITLACMKKGIRQIAYRQENSGSYMAQAYGMASRKVPVVTAQNGPAAALLISGLSECLKASHPVVALVQQIALHDYEKNAFQEIDHDALFAGCSKWTKTIYSKDRIEDYIDMAFTQAVGGRPGPVVLLLPVDLFNDATAYPRTLCRTECLGYRPLDRTVADPSRVQEAAALLMYAERPVIYAGGGVISSGAQAALRVVQDRFSIPVATTTMGKGSVDETHPLSIGVSGYISGKRGMAKFLKPLLSEADVILLVGNRTNQNGTDSWSLLPKNAAYIHIDVDPCEIGRNYEAMRLVGDAKLTLEALGKSMAELDGSKRASQRKTLEQTIRSGREQHMQEIRDVITEVTPACVRPERLMVELEKHLEPDHLLVADASFSSIWIANYIQAKDNREFYFPRGLAGLGAGLPLAMGVKVARPDKKVLCISGDGGFAHVWSELETCKREGIDVVSIVLNNACLGYQYYAEHAKFGDHTNACDVNVVDYVKLAEACGVCGMRINTPEEIDEVMARALRTPGSVVVDVITDVRSVPPVTLLQKAVSQE